jgi:hypothetical protein
MTDSKPETVPYVSVTVIFNLSNGVPDCMSTLIPMASCIETYELASEQNLQRRYSSPPHHTSKATVHSVQLPNAPNDFLTMI